jgi:hypothetical protein
LNPTRFRVFKIQSSLEWSGVKPRHTAIKKAYCTKRFYRRQQHQIENAFCRIKDWGAPLSATTSFAVLAATTVVGVLYWIRL